jgi:hypothetical protein
MKDDWSLKKQKIEYPDSMNLILHRELSSQDGKDWDEEYVPKCETLGYIILEYFSIKDIGILRKKLIEDIESYIIHRFHTYYKGEIKKIINKRFGICGDGKKDEERYKNKKI